MSNNARVVTGRTGRAAEIGSAQYFQALAAGVRPDVRMNPVLLKPEHDLRSQVIVLGEVDEALASVPWRQRSQQLWPIVQASLDELLGAYDVVVIEGAGSPAEINLQPSDIVNMRVARHAHAACLLVADIDRGGAFAHLYGTHQLLPEAERALLRGFVLNKFRGDAGLLSPAPELLQQRTGVPTVAVLPMWRGHGLPEEDGIFDDHPSGNGNLTIGVIAPPRLSNLDEFQALRHVEGVRVKWVRTPADLSAVDWLVLPGSKHVSGDLAWMRAQRLDEGIVRHACAGRPVLGLCGGLQMLGEALVDPHGVDGNAPGLGLLPLVTVYERDKLVRPVSARFSNLADPWAALSGVQWDGYEIHHGRTKLRVDLPPADCALVSGEGETIGWQQGNVLGLYAHGLFESPQVLAALFGRHAAGVPTASQVFDGLADFIESHFRPGALHGLLADVC